MTKDRDDELRLVRRHFLAGWWLLFVFAGLGAILEVFHALKLGLYVDVGNATRRLMWTLAHAHGVLLGLVNIAFAVTLSACGMRADRASLASASLLGASVLLPGGFFLGGVVVYGGDPGLGILLTPAGAALLLSAVYLVLRRIGGEKPDDERAGGDKRR